MKAVVVLLAVAPSLISGLSPKSVFGRELADSPQKLGPLMEDPDFLMKVFADNTMLFGIEGKSKFLTAGDYQTFLDEGQTSMYSPSFTNKPLTSTEDLLNVYMDISLNPDFKRISQIFALQQLALPHRAISINSHSNFRNHGQAGCFSLKGVDDYMPQAHTDVFSNGRPYRDVKATFIHEASHVAIQRVYENEANPYPSGAKERKEKYENAFELVNINLEELAHEQASFTDVEKYFYDRWHEILMVYPVSKYHVETIVLLPEVLAQFDIEVKDLPPRLHTAVEAYLEYWDSINQDISAYTTRMQNILDITDIESTYHEEIRLNADLVQKENLYDLIKQGKYSRKDFKDFTSDQLAVLNKKGSIQALLENRLSLEDIENLTPRELSILDQEETQQALLEGRFNFDELKKPGSTITKKFKTTIEAAKEETPDTSEADLGMVQKRQL